ncbi:MAG: hypothetical protein ACK4L7_07040 [Flavobacteriales bacterium]
MIHVTIQTRSLAAAERLAEHLMKRGLLLFPTLDTDHEELTLRDGSLVRDRQLLLQGMTKALLYRDVERESYELLKDQVVRIHATPITHMDPEAQRTLLEQTMKV